MAGERKIIKESFKCWQKSQSSEVKWYLPREAVIGFMDFGIFSICLCICML
jgi:hypothetical protein